MLAKLLTAIPYVLLTGASLTGGFIAGSKQATKQAEALIVPCPACNCPPAAVLHLAPDFDVTKINNRKGTFHYEPKTEFQGSITIQLDCKDSTFLKEILDKSKN